LLSCSTSPSQLSSSTSRQPISIGSSKGKSLDQIRANLIMRILWLR